MWGGSERTALRKGRLDWNPRDNRDYPGNGAASSQASQSLGFPSVDEMARTGPGQGTRLVTEMNFMPSTVRSAHRNIRTQEPCPGRVLDIQAGFLLQEAGSEVKTLWADGVGAIGDGWEAGGG